VSRRLKVYAHVDSCNCILPSDVIDALGERTHVRQGHLYVWATTAKAAAERFAAVGLRSVSARELRVATHGTAQVLDAASNWPDGTMLAVRLSGGGTVIEITENPNRSVIDSPRTLRPVGDLSHAIVFRPVDDIEPVVTDHMVDTALEALQSSMPDGTPVGWLISNMRAAIAAALKAQRAQL
jgi:hypothetical protein